MENPIAFSIVAFSVLLTLAISLYSRKWTKTRAEFYVAGGNISWKLNGLAMIGDFCSAASFLGIAGAIALMGIDGWWIGIGFFGSWVAVLLIVAGPLKSCGKFTMGDVLVARFGNVKRIKILAMLSTIILCTLYLVPQIVGAGHLFELLLGWDYLTTVIMTGILMAVFVTIGGMRGTTYNQAIQGIMLWVAMLLLVIFASIAHFSWNPLAIITASSEIVPPLVSAEMPEAVDIVRAAEDPSSAITAVRALMPDAPSALTPGVGLKNIWNQLSLVLGFFLGILGLPHILIRFYTVRDAKAAEKSAELTIIALGIFYVLTLFVGLAAMYLLYPTLVQLLADGYQGVATNMAVPILGQMLGGEVALGIIAAGALAAMLSTSTGLLISATTSLIHDLYGGILKPHSTEKEQLIFAKAGSVVLAAVAIGLSVWLVDENVGILVGMCFGIAASTFAPVLVCSIWWNRLTKQAVIAAMTVGLISSLLFTFAKFLGVSSILGLPVLINPALYSVPAAVIVLILTSFLTKDRGKVEEFMATAHRG